MEKVKLRKLKILLLPGSFISPSARFRIWQFKQPLINSGFDVEVRVPAPDRIGKGDFFDRYLGIKLPPRLKSLLRLLSAIWQLRDAKKFDYIIANRDIVPELRVTFMEKGLIHKGSKLIFDFDDAIHLGKRSQKLASFLPGCYCVTPGNPYLAEYAQQHNSNVQIIPTVVDTSFYVPVPSRVPGKARIGWSGSSSTNTYCLPLLQPVMEQLAKELDFEFIVISNEDPNIHWEGVQTQFLLWTPETEVSNLQLLDVGLMPLNDSPFERGKCGLKAIQYMGIGIPALVSPVGVNKEIVTHGENGYHCSDQDDWVEHIKYLIKNEEVRMRMGTKARDTVVAEYSVVFALELWKKILV